MNREEIERGNEIIGKFMGLDRAYDIRDRVYHYHDDWNWMMRVLDKIELLNYRIIIKAVVDYWTNVPRYICNIQQPERFGNYRCYKSSSKRIDAVYEAVIDFIINYKKETT